jgi:hypothetical protein
MAYREHERGAVDPHHEPPIGRDLGTRPRAELDRDTIPLCHPHHMERHDKGDRAFWARYDRVDWRAVREHMRRGIAPWSEFVHVPA